MSHHPQPVLDSPVHELIAARWSPYVYQEKAVPAEDLRALFEAARWAASSYNEQPWRFIVATREQSTVYGKILDSLMEGNQAWARKAPVLVLALVRKDLALNGAPNNMARHDLGLASANLSLEAAARDLMVHPMGGILPDKARENFAVPEEYEVVTALAIGYAGEPEGELGERDQKRRPRRSVEEFVFGENFGEAFDF